ncbi:MAG: ThuA domain-containing protein [Prosthecobacter sp.]|uniref:PVC-type heme-binding CxxCH protein n=1 Tax=Prosthecobacter sp. TaxID=1965333 RepID=UPI0025EF4F41|nr:PVC-type heme-binding CxxCH protein [Prosthecobacter sp.]MCF7785401.1 ThuA domain-containing protein [Prosthecobacter sp.]
MKRFLFILALAASCVIPHSSFAAEPLRVFIHSGPKSHGPGAHDHPSFLRDWVPLLNERGAKATGGDAFPSKEQLDATDVLILHLDNGGDIKIGQERKDLLEYLARGGGIVTIHAASVSKDHDWFKGIIGGSWHHGQTKWREGPMHLYFTDHENPITLDVSNFAMDDEIYYDMDVLPECHILAGAYTPKPAGVRNEKAAKRAAEITKGGKEVSIYDIQPQVWTYEKDNYRSFVSIPGHYYANFSRLNFRALLLRGIAWAGKRENVDELCKPEELGDNLRYVEGGPTRPEKAAEKLEVHPKFDISLVASEPLINKVMNVDWDEKGRLWVCETPEYPNGRRELNVEKWKDSGSWTKKYDRDPIDRISILSDTNGDGVMDKKHVFADKLELVTSFCFYKNGVIACAAPDIWFLEDTDGDETADKRTKLYTGLGTGDTHAVINNLRWGLDGWVYATHGYSAGHVTSPDGKLDFGTDGSGVVRFKPDGSAFEQYASRGGNTWGLDITTDGQVFFTQPTSGNHFLHVVLPEYVLAKGKLPGVMGTNGMLPKEPTYPLMSWPEQAYVQIDQVGSYTAAAGCAIYEGGAWPAKWNYSYFTTEPTLNIVSHFFVEKDGVTYKAHREAGSEKTEFIRSKDLWFRPIENRVGPDGALYVVDFYNQAVIHNDTRGPIHGPANAAVRPDRDHYFGRIWKVQHKQATKVEVVDLSQKNTDQLLEFIGTSPSGPAKETAFRLLESKLTYAEAKTRKLGLIAMMNAHNRRLTPQEEAQHMALARVVHALRPSDTKTLEKDVLIDGLGTFGTKMQPEELYLTIEAGLKTTGTSKVVTEAMKVFASADNDWTRSAVIAACVDQAFPCIESVLANASMKDAEVFVTALLPSALPANADKLVAACASADSKADAIKIAILGGIAQQLNEAPALTPELTGALKKLLAQPALAAAALPLVVKWDRAGVLSAEVKGQIARLTAKLEDKAAAMGDRITAAKALIGIGGEASALVVGALSRSDSPGALQAAIIGAMDEKGSVTELVGNLNGLKPELRTQAFDAILKRPEASLALLGAIQEGKIDPKEIGPGNIARLRTHPNKQVAKRANAMIEKLNPNAKAKNELLAQLTPEVEKPGDAVKGKAMFAAACAVCHKLGDLGLRDVGPQLTGMGAHGPAELLVHIVDPNREVDPSFWAWNITTKKGETQAGVIITENQASLTLRNQVGDFEIKKDDIATRENTRRSLMPDGLDALGAETLRDILAFICGGEQKFRVIDLRTAYNADSRAGIFAKEDAKDQTVTLHKFGNVTVNGVPFFVMDPEKSQTGASLIALKGGGKGTVAENFPEKVEIATSATAVSLHFLGGVAGWGWPFGGDKALGQPAMTVQVEFADGDKESIVLKNGEHFADYIGKAEVPLSDDAGDFTRRGQLRYFAINLKKKGALKKITLETSGSIVTPCTVAITASAETVKQGETAAGGQANSNKLPWSRPKAWEGNARYSGAVVEAGPKEGGKGDGPLVAVTPVKWEAGKTKVLVIGGGSSHNFAKFFGETDVATLKAAGFTVHYTEDRDQAAAELANADVAVISVNRKFFDTAVYRKALFDFAAAGKGIIMLHPGTWYGFGGWPELNAQIVGGGARGHDKIHPFEVKAVKADHPIMAGVPASFTVEDELYYVNAEPDKIPEGTAKITVLAETSPSDKYKAGHPSVWITEHAKAKVVGIALGHDQRVHDLKPYQQILINAVKWASGK